MTGPLISIVTPTRNRYSFLVEAVASVCAQTIADWEFLIIDDHSSDATSTFIAGLSDPRILSFRLDEHGERSAARNLGLSKARAPFVMFLDDDDMLRPDALRLLAAELVANPSLVAAVGGLRFREANQDSTLQFQTSHPCTLSIWRDLLFSFTPNSGQNLYRTQAVRFVGGYDPCLATCEDRAMWLRVARLGPVRVIPQVVLDYRQHSGQSKPSTLAEIRARVIEAFIETLPLQDRAEARRLRLAANLIEQDTLAAWIGAARTAPYILRSPLSRRQMWWRLRALLLRSRLR